MPLSNPWEVALDRQRPVGLMMTQFTLVNPTGRGVAVERTVAHDVAFTPTLSRW
jgi:hypothetical protein